MYHSKNFIVPCASVLKSNCLLWTAYFLQYEGRLLRFAKLNDARNVCYPLTKGYISALSRDNSDRLRQLFAKNTLKLCEFTILRSWSNQRIHYSRIFFWSPYSLWLFITAPPPLPHIWHLFRQQILSILDRGSLRYPRSSGFTLVTRKVALFIDELVFCGVVSTCDCTVRRWSKLDSDGRHPRAQFSRWNDSPWAHRIHNSRMYHVALPLTMISWIAILVIGQMYFGASWFWKGLKLFSIQLRVQILKKCRHTSWIQKMLSKICRLNLDWGYVFKKHTFISHFRAAKQMWFILRSD